MLFRKNEDELIIFLLRKSSYHGKVVGYPYLERPIIAISFKIAHFHVSGHSLFTLARQSFKEKSVIFAFTPFLHIYINFSLRTHENS